MNRRLPDDPFIRDLVLRARNAQLSRRRLLQLGGVGAAALTLAACAPAKESLIWWNWPAYLDEDDSGRHPTLEAFTAETGVAVDYSAVINDNNEFYARARDALSLGQWPGFDTACVTEWLVGRLVGEGMVQELDASRIPNKANLSPGLLNPDFDPGRNKSLPWQSGFAGLVWDTDQFPNGLESVDDLWDPELAGRVVVLSEMRDTMGVLMLSQGVDISGSGWGEAEFGNALELLDEHLSSGQIYAVMGNEYIGDFETGQLAAGIVWSGDVTAMNLTAGYEKYKFALPDSGGTLWSDTFVIPNGARHKAWAEDVMNWYYDPAIAAEVAVWVNYITPVVGAKEFAVDLDPDAAENWLIFPEESDLEQAHIFRTLSAQEDEAYTAEFLRFA